MKKLLLLSTVVVLMSGCIQIPRQDKPQNTDEITVDRAKEIALEHASLKANDVTFVKTQMDRDNHTKKYEIEFYANNTEYDYDIDASTGEILAWDKDIENYTIPTDTPTQSDDEISEDKAKEIALSHAGLSHDQATFVKSQLDYDDGRKTYEIEFYAGNREFDYEIDAATGKLLSWDEDIENHTIPKDTPTQSNNEISEDNAKEIALSHAGLNSSDVTFMKAQLDYDDRIKTYEIEFYAGNIEYDYEIDASTGEILAWDKDSKNH